MTADEAHSILTKNCDLDVGKFYGSSSTLTLGSGLIYSNVRHPKFDQSDNLFSTVEGAAYVLTHECDIDQRNERSFNDYVTICPLIAISAFVVEYDAAFRDDNQLRGFLTAIAKREVSRVVYIPPKSGDLKFGAFAYLNNLSSTHVSVFANALPVAAVSAYGLREFDQALTNHLLRPKAQRLSFET